MSIREVPLPWRVVLVISGCSVTMGGVAGGILGLRYLPTLPAAIAEGAFIAGLPVASITSIMAAIWIAVRRWKGHH